MPPVSSMFQPTNKKVTRKLTLHQPARTTQPTIATPPSHIHTTQPQRIAGSSKRRFFFCRASFGLRVPLASSYTHLNAALTLLLVATTNSLCCFYLLTFELSNPPHSVCLCLSPSLTLLLSQVAAFRWLSRPHSVALWAAMMPVLAPFPGKPTYASAPRGKHNNWLPRSQLMICGYCRCGGSLISRRHVVTAGHCVARATPRQVHVTLGDYVINSAVEPLPAYTFGVRRIDVHPYFKFTPQADRFDVSVLTLERTVHFMPHIGKATPRLILSRPSLNPILPFQRPSACPRRTRTFWASLAGLPAGAP